MDSFSEVEFEFTPRGSVELGSVGLSFMPPLITKFSQKSTIKGVRGKKTLQFEAVHSMVAKAVLEPFLGTFTWHSVPQTFCWVISKT